MSSYRPYSAAETTRPYEYVYSAPVRFCAGLAMTVWSAGPMLAISYLTAFYTGELLGFLPSIFSSGIVMLILATMTANVLRYMSKPERPRVAEGCIPDEQAAEKKRVAVIGAGISGLMAAKELIAEGHEVVVFEEGSEVGGAWAVNGDTGRGRVWDRTISSTSALNSGISDFPLDSYYPSAEDPYHVSHGVFREYVANYAKAFNILPSVRFHHRVLHVSQTLSSGSEGWSVTVQRLGTDAPTVEQFDFLAVCTGQVQVPKAPRFDGQEKFSGEILHVSSVSNVDKFKGKTVVCVGIGETGSDLTEFVSEKAKSSFLSVRNPFVCLPRNFFGVPPDFFETRALYGSPHWVRWAILKTQLLSASVMQFWNLKSESGKTVGVPDWRKVLGVLLTFNYHKEVFLGQRSACSSLLVTKSERFLYPVDNGTCVIKPGVDRFDENGVFFEDGSYEKCDAVILSTGYKQGHFPIFGEDSFLSSSATRSRYLLTFDPDVGASVAFLGFCRGQTGSLIVPAEMQARWFALIVSGKRKLPSLKEMRAEIEEQRIGDQGSYAVTLGGWFMANCIARYHVGCEPSAFRLLATHGPVIAWRVYTQSFAGYMYRFEGPHAKPALAESIYRTIATCGKPVAWHFMDVLSLSLGVVFDTISQVPFFGKSRIVNPLMDRFW